jgi:GNAT superfamily N-acetyltransferase
MWDGRFSGTTKNHRFSDQGDRATKKIAASTATRINYEVKELSSTTWPDFEKFFAKHNGVQGGCWCTFYHHAEGRLLKQGLERKDAIALNRKEKKSLVTKGRSHGILVYAGNQAVGWCQYGPKEELPRIDSGRNYSKLDLSADQGRNLWRLTCFFVDRDFRKKGVAGVALKAALDSIRKQGGGIVEAYPPTWKEGGSWALWFGTVAMYEREGFKAHAKLGERHLLMRKTLA